MSDLMSEVGKPFTVADRVIGVLISLGSAGLGVWMWLRPALVIVGDETASGRGGRKVLGLLRLIDLVWSRPLAVILLIFAVMVMWNAFTRESAKTGSSEAVGG